MHYLDFPVAFNVKSQDLPSLFAEKCHALLCREYTKGRDWYDFIWYVSKQIIINFEFLENALIQVGPWHGHKIHLTPKWFFKEMENKISAVNWAMAKKDVARFLKPHDLPSLELWSKAFFLSRLEKVRSTLAKYYHPPH